MIIASDCLGLWESHGLWESQGFSCTFPRVLDGRAGVGARIREVREHVRLKSQELAELVGVDPSAMSNIENGKRSVKTDELLRIASALRVSPIALLDEGSLLSRLAVAPRVELGERLDSVVLERLTALAELHDVLETEGVRSAPALDDAPAVDESDWLRSAEVLAAWATDRLNVKAEGDERFAALVQAIEEDLRVDVVVERMNDSAVIGAALTDREFPLIFVNATNPTSRALFTLAHELGHVLSGQGSIAIDQDLGSGNNRERFANAFAATFLMPESAIRDQIAESGRGARSLALLLDRLGVSFESLVYRLHNLQLINASGRDQLQQMGVRGLLARLDDERLSRSVLRRLGMRPERHPPAVLALRSFDGFRRGVISGRPLAGLLDLDADDLLDHLSRLEEAGDLVESADFRPSGQGRSADELYDGDAG